MTLASASGNGSRVSRVIRAPRATIYRAFLDPQAVAAWMAPDTMRSTIHTFEAREGGQFRISLSYAGSDDTERGKTDATTDTYHGRFAELIPNEKIVEIVEFESADPAFGGEMTMTVTLADVEGGTEVTLQYDNVPPGIRPEDTEVGSRSSLQKLAALVE